MNDYDFYLNNRTIRDGEWAGFALAWKGLAGAANLPAQPYRRWLPWFPDKDYPDDASLGSWGHWHWRLDVALLEGLVGLQGRPPEDGRTVNDMRDDLLAFLALPSIGLMDLDGGIFEVRMTGYTEQAIEPYDISHPNGGALVTVELTKLDF